MANVIRIKPFLRPNSVLPETHKAIENLGLDFVVMNHKRFGLDEEEALELIDVYPKDIKKVNRAAGMRV